MGHFIGIFKYSNIHIHNCTQLQRSLQNKRHRYGDFWHRLGFSSEVFLQFIVILVLFLVIIGRFTVAPLVVDASLGERLVDGLEEEEGPEDVEELEGAKEAIEDVVGGKHLDKVAGIDEGGVEDPVGIDATPDTDRVRGGARRRQLEVRQGREG